MRGSATWRQPKAQGCQNEVDPFSRASAAQTQLAPGNCTLRIVAGYPILPYGLRAVESFMCVKSSPHTTPFGRTPETFWPQPLSARVGSERPNQFGLCFGAALSQCDFPEEIEGSELSSLDNTGRQSFLSARLLAAPGPPASSAHLAVGSAARSSLIHLIGNLRPHEAS